MNSQILIMSKQTALKRLSKEILPTDECYYLHDDYIDFLKIKRTISPKHEIHLLGKRFHEILSGVQEEFLHLCHTINSQNKSDLLWDTQLASRNSASIPVLKNIVYLLCAEEIIRDAGSRIILICDSPALARMLRDEAGRQGYSCLMMLSPWDLLQQQVKLYMRLGWRGGSFLFLAFMQWIYVRFLKNKRITRGSGLPVYILRSWVTAGNVNEQGIYKDRNFGELPEYLRREGKDVWILPMFFNLDRSIFAQMKLMAESPNQFIFPEQHLSLMDLLKTFRDGIKSIFLNLEKCELRGQNVSPIIKEAHLAMSLPVQLLFLNSVKYLIDRLKLQGIIIERFIYPFENNPAEKSFILAARRCYPDAEIVGFQHTVWFKEQLGMYLHPEEVSYHPLPDRVVCSGQRYLDVLGSVGFPISILRSGPNLRYISVNQNVNSICRNSIENNQKSVLIILNFDYNQILELLDKVGKALQMVNDDIKVFIKPHPINSVNVLEDFLRQVGFPEYKWVRGTVQEWIARVNVVIMSGGSVSNLETIVMGVPLLRVSLENNFNFDPLWDEYPLPSFSSSPEEITSFLKNAFQLSDSERESLIAFGEMIAEKYFEPLTPERLKTFYSDVS